MPDEATSPIYSARYVYVAFADILGFSNIVRNSINSPHQAGELAKILQRLANRTTPSIFDQGDGDDFRGQSFSDCIVLSRERDA